MPLKILVTGDIHIGRVASYVRNEDSILATKNVWIKMVDYVIKESLDAMILTGDIVDQENKHFEAFGPLQEGFSKLNEANIPVFIVIGNHDATVLAGLIEEKKYPNLFLLGANGKWTECKTRLKGRELQLIGWSFPKPHFANNPILDLPDNLIETTVSTLGIIHCDINSKESNYAPIPLNDLLALRGVDAWLLGHIHKPETLNKRNPYVCYPGSPQAMSPKEQGPHGAILLSISENNFIDYQPILFSATRYDEVIIDITEVEQESEIRKLVTEKIRAYSDFIVEELGEVKYLIIDLWITGIHRNIQELQNLLRNIKEDFEFRIVRTSTNVSVRKLSYKVQPKIENIAILAQEKSPAGIIAQTILDIENNQLSAFSERLVKDWIKKKNELDYSRTFIPLMNKNEDEKDHREEAKKLLLQECNRILSELIKQK